MNTHKRIILGLVLCLVSPALIDAAVPCGTATGTAGRVLNVGILPGNLPYSDVVLGQAIGFDPLLVKQVAKLLGYNTVNFIGFGNTLLALGALAAGTIDIYANSNLNLPTPATSIIGIVTDISHLYLSTGPVARGWVLNVNCCTLGEQIDAAITKLVDTGVYAQLLQAVRLAGEAAGLSLGVPFTTGAVSGTGTLLEPFPFASNEIGTIPDFCAPAGANLVVSLPTINCISGFLQSTCSSSTTFTGATGQIPLG